MNETATHTRWPLTPLGDVRATARVCMAASCLASGADAVIDALATRIEAGGLSDVAVKRVGCLGLCVAGPLIEVAETGELVSNATADDLDALVATLSKVTTQSARAERGPFFERQVQVVTENSGRIDPEELADYLAVGGYESLHLALTTMTPSQVVSEITSSGLRGRGGGGYPTGLKWQTVAKSGGELKYVVCNADEGDPGAFMDRSVLESDPHRVLEGMAIAGFAVGARKGFVYCRAEYPLAVSRLRIAIGQAKGRGFLGDRIFDTTFGFDIELRVGAGAYVCGEETALMASIQGGRGTPHPRPPFPATSGLWGKPTLINNVETFAAVAPIIRNGGDWYRSIGTERSAGTKVIALAGRIVNTGVIEVPMGTTLRTVVYEMGGGLIDDRPFKAVQTGGPSGGCIPAQFLDLPITYEALAAVGSIMGSGGMMVMDDTACMVDVAKYFMDFCREESCGKCVPCRVGTTHLWMLLTAITNGQATMADLEQVESLSRMVKDMSLCGLGRNAPNPIVSTLRYFRDEYVAHITEKRCPAGVCPMTPATPVTPVIPVIPVTPTRGAS